MNEDEDEPDPTGYAAIANGIEELRELTNAIVAGFEADGFTPAQAREMTAAFMIQLWKDRSA